MSFVCTHNDPQLFEINSENEQLFMGRYSVAGTAEWGAYTVMTGTDAKTGRAVCLKVTSDYARHTAETRARHARTPLIDPPLVACI